MSDTATIPLWDAIGGVIEAGADLPTFLLTPRFYRGSAPADSVPAERIRDSLAWGYFLLGLVTLVPGGSYNGETGEDGTATIHCWADTPDNAERLYRWLRGLLHDRPLTVAGFGTVTGQMRKTGPTSDAEGTAFQVTALYTVEPEDG